MSRNSRRARPEQRPRRGRRPVLAWLSLTIGALLVLASGAGLATAGAVLSAARHSVPPEDLLGNEGRQASQSGHVEITGAKTILLVGIDARPGQDPNELVRSDSIIIAHIPAAHDSAYLVSIPRDTMVKIPSYDNGARRYAGGYEKINAAYAYGGQGLTGVKARGQAVRLLAKTIKEAYGVAFDGAAIVDFDGFRDVVRVLGGVDINVDEEVTSVHIGFTRDGQVKAPFRQVQRADGGTDLIPVPGVRPQVYKVGEQHMSPDEALDFARQRETLDNGDYDRQRHQQQFLKAVVKGIASKGTLTNPLKLKGVLDAVGKAMTIDSGGIGLEDWAYAMRGIGGDNIVTIKTNGGSYHSSGTGGEALDEATLALLRSVSDDTVGTFLMEHPELQTAA